MKTQALKETFELIELDTWGNQHVVRYEFETATDIFTIRVYKKGIFGWKKVADGWAFSGMAKKIRKFLDNWLE